MMQPVCRLSGMIAWFAACSIATAYAAPTAPATSATRTVYHDTNHTGHVVLERDDTGAILGTPHRYSPYGVVLGEDPVAQEAPRFGGKLRDPHSNLDDFSARRYTSEYARFLSVDSAQDGSHYYAFGHNNPLKYTDPTGQVAFAPLLFGAIALGGVVYDYCGEAATHLGYSYGTGTATWTTLRGGLEAALCVGEFIQPATLVRRGARWLGKRTGLRSFDTAFRMSASAGDDAGGRLLQFPGRQAKDALHTLRQDRKLARLFQKYEVPEGPIHTRILRTEARIYTKVGPYVDAVEIVKAQRRGVGVVRRPMTLAARELLKDSERATALELVNEYLKLNRAIARYYDDLRLLQQRAQRGGVQLSRHVPDVTR